jgi:glycosyltransferase involved in cell wall biosynthesis
MKSVLPVDYTMSKNLPSVIISAYAVYPLPNIAEGVVNAALLDALRSQIRIGLVTSPSGYQPVNQLQPGQDHVVRVYADDRNSRSYKFLELLADWRAYPKWHPNGAFVRLVDHVRVNVKKLAPLCVAAWGRCAAAQILQWLEGDFRDAVIWARATPPESFEAAISAFRRNPFPLVVNYNDPMPHCLLWGKTHGNLNPAFDDFQHRQNRFLASNAQAWTFPSRRLADMMASVAGLDRNRCFVIPHLVPRAEWDSNQPLPDGPWLLYAGTFYSSVFSEKIRSGIAQYAQAGGKLRLRFVLKQPTAQVHRWIDQAVPGAQVHANLSPVEVASLLQKAQAILVLDCPYHSPLLLTKVVESVCSNKPVLAFTSPQSTTHEVISAAGGIVIDPVTAERVKEGLHLLEQLLEDHEKRRWPMSDRQRVMSRFDPERITNDSIAVLEYARQRFCWRQRRTGKEPEPPAIESWP